MWNTTEELARIRRQELLAEAAAERLARVTRASRCEVAPAADVVPAKRRRVSETVVR